MFVGIVYFFVILISCILGAIVGLGGGVFITPIFVAIGYHNVLNISFFASSAILIMAVVSTVKKIKDGILINPKKAILISIGAITGGIIGNLLLEHLVSMFDNDYVQLVQIICTVVVLILSLYFTAKNNLRYEVKSKSFPLLIGIAMGSIATFIGIGGGPINVPIFMIFYGLNRKDAAAYSIVIIFFSHMARIINMGFTLGYSYFDLSFLPYVAVAAVIGGFVGAKLTMNISENAVKRLFQGVISLIIVLNVANGVFLI